ncbi:MAG: hypothetical protein EOM47_14195 [Bacteroidia bacterium]|nr:hypothetical protein [Bacteroidia bacterium]
MKKIIVSLLSVIAFLPVFSQGFASFNVEGSFQPALIKNVTDGPSFIEVMVGEKTDIKNIKFKYKLYSGCSLEKDLSADFTQPQTVVVNKNDGNSKEWVINVKQLKSASLPLELAFFANNLSVWNQGVTGWATIGVDSRITSAIRFGNKGVSFWVAINKPAKKLDYQLKMVSKEKVIFDGEFLVETSADGRSWSLLNEFNEQNQISADGNYRHDISKDVRFIRWTYVTRNKLNLNLNNIYVSAE